MTTHLWWLRHGEPTDHSAQHIHHMTPLSPEGVAAATQLATRLPPSTTITSSSLRRAKQTAEAVHAAAPHIVLLPPNDAFNEWRAPDSVVGLSPADYPPPYKAWKARRLQEPDSRLPGGESLRQFATRVHHAQQEAAALRASCAARHLIIVSHQLMIGAIDAAGRHGLTDPALIFEHARKFQLPYTQFWSLERTPSPPTHPRQ